MSTLKLDQSSGTYQIRAFKPGIIQINDQTFTESIILTPETLIENQLPQTHESLNAETLAKVIPLKPDILLIGTGSKHHFLPVSYYGELINQGIGIEIMDTAAACRTFNALSAENRNVAAVLIIL